MYRPTVARPSFARATLATRDDAMSSVDRLLNAKEVCKLTSVSQATLYRLIKANKFPKPLRLGPQVTRWRSDEIAAHLDRLSAARGAA